MIEKYLIVKKNPWRTIDGINYIIYPVLYKFKSELHYKLWFWFMNRIKGYGILDEYKGKPLDGSPLNIAKSYEWWWEI